MRRALNLTVFAVCIASAVGAPFVTDGNWMFTAAGIWLAIAALVQLERGVAVVVALAALLWSALWGWAATRMRGESSRVTP